MRASALVISLIFLCFFQQGYGQSAAYKRFAHVNRDRDAVQQMYLKMYLPAAQHPEGWVDPGNCRPGTLPKATLDARLQELNYFRKMAGLQAVTLNAEYNKYAQAAAHLMFSNRALNHHPPKDWKCYSELGATGASRCNLGYGGGILGYMTDFGENNRDCGHRMWILRGEANELGYGGTDFTDAIYVFGGSGEPDSLPQYVAWPPAGFVPAEIIDDRWTIAIPGEYAKFDKATVTLTCEGRNIPLTYAQQTGYGDGGLAFEIANYRNLEDKMLDKHIKVSVKNIVVGQEIRSFNYEVVLFTADAAHDVISYNDDHISNEADSDDAAGETEAEEPVKVVPFSEMPCTDIAVLTQDSAMSRLAFETLKKSAVRDLVCNRDFCSFATKLATLRRDKNPDAEKLLTWAENKIKMHLAHKANLTEEQTANAVAPKFLLVEVKQLVPLDGSMNFEDIAVQMSKKFVADPELADFTARNKYIRQGGLGLVTKRVTREGKAYAGIYATLVIAPSKLRLAS